MVQNTILLAVHGTLLFSVAIGIDAGLINEAAMKYDNDKLRFIKPVFITGTKITIGKKDHKKSHTLE